MYYVHSKLSFRKYLPIFVTEFIYMTQPSMKFGELMGQRSTKTKRRAKSNWLFLFRLFIAFYLLSCRTYVYMPQFSVWFLKNNSSEN